MNFELAFIVAVALGVAVVLVILVLVGVIVFQRWRISDNNVHLEKFISENIELRRLLLSSGKELPENMK